MPYFSQRSRERLLTCDSRLIQICSEVIKHYDFSVLCGHRTQEEQEAAVAAGHSMLHWPHSRHNKNPSLAVDVAPYPISWSREDRFIELAGAMLYVARTLGIPLEWGGHWETFKDYPHFQVPPRDDD